MDDLVQRLRDADGPTDGGDALALLCHAAADEIERLRTYADRLIERLERAPDETRAIDAELKSKE